MLTRSRPCWLMTCSSLDRCSSAAPARPIWRVFTPIRRNRVRIGSWVSPTVTVAVFYDYEKPSGALADAQQFRFKDGQIAEIFLVFDASGFTRALS